MSHYSDIKHTIELWLMQAANEFFADYVITATSPLPAGASGIVFNKINDTMYKVANSVKTQDLPYYYFLFQLEEHSDAKAFPDNHFIGISAFQYESDSEVLITTRLTFAFCIYLEDSQLRHNRFVDFLLDRFDRQTVGEVLDMKNATRATIGTMQRIDKSVVVFPIEKSDTRLIQEIGIGLTATINT